ncbi:hypothetical protein HK099_003866 [Clydaea vesicula]|uniref:t-SNARE coiled-coil homology domain-containing protein n=1 Tax=Clydaea vesicula TaxID=447962 RepID=A0AAD5XYQ1_9FUNG|nr:hypothetical protein HK099_003866 [Clydaea vesicula]KAJ3397658.1 hypothetical protein HDU92_005400 [Lobulomyces angularis]
MSKTNNPLRRPNSLNDRVEIDEFAELTALTSETLAVQDQSVNTVSNSVNLALKAQQMASTNTNLLNSQGEQLRNSSKKMDEVDSKLTQAKVKTDYLNKFTRPFFIPVFGKDPNIKTDLKTFEKAESSEEDDGPPPVFTKRLSSLPPGGFENYNREVGHAKVECKVGGWATEEEKDRSLQSEQKIDEGLNVIGGALSSIKLMALQNQQELERQEGYIKRTEEQVSYSEEKLNKVNNKLNKVLKS